MINLDEWSSLRRRAVKESLTALTVQAQDLRSGSRTKRMQTAKSILDSMESISRHPEFRPSEVANILSFIERFFREQQSAFGEFSWDEIYDYALLMSQYLTIFDRVITTP